MKKIYKIDAPRDIAFKRVIAALKNKSPLGKKRYDGLSFETFFPVNLSFETFFPVKKIRTSYMFQKRASETQVFSCGESEDVSDEGNTKTSFKSYVDYSFCKDDDDDSKTVVVATFKNKRKKIEFIDVFAAVCPLIVFLFGLLSSYALSDDGNIFVDPVLYLSFALSAALEAFFLYVLRSKEPHFDPAERLERLVDEAFAEIEDCKCIEVQK